MQNTNGNLDLLARTPIPSSRNVPAAVRAGSDRLPGDEQVPYSSEQFGGDQVAAYIGAQSVLQRLDAVVPERWRPEVPAARPAPRHQAADAVYEEVGEIDAGSRAGLKARPLRRAQARAWPPGSAPTCTPRWHRWCCRSGRRSARSN